MDKLSTFAPALLERQSLMIDILLMIKGSENKNQKTSKKVWMLSEKVLIFAVRFAKKRCFACSSFYLFFPFRIESQRNRVKRKTKKSIFKFN